MIKRKLLFILHFPPPVHGSAVVGKQIFESKVINEAIDGDYVNLSTSRSLDEIGKRGGVKYLRVFFIYLNVLYRLCTNKYDLCYLAITVTSAGLLRDAPLVLLCKLFGKKVVLHQHNKGVSLFHNRRLYNWIYRKIYHNSKVILLSWYLYGDISKYVNKSEVCICPNGIKPLDFLPYRDIQDTYHFLFLSNLIESKGCFVLLDACKILNEKGYSFVCDFVGGESSLISKSVLECEIKKRHLEANVIYHGKKTGDDKAAFFLAADAFVFPTMNDCFPLVLLEAMQYKLPVISTNIGAILDELLDNETGYIVPQKNPYALADKMELLLKNPNNGRSMGQAGYDYYLANFTEDKFENRMREILLSL